MAVGLFAIGWEGQKHRHTCPNVERLTLIYPTVSQMQEFLGVEVDGKFGRESRAKYEAWSKEQEFNQNACE